MADATEWALRLHDWEKDALKDYTGDKHDLTEIVNHLKRKWAMDEEQGAAYVPVNKADRPTQNLPQRGSLWQQHATGFVRCVVAIAHWEEIGLTLAVLNDPPHALPSMFNHAIPHHLLHEVMTLIVFYLLLAKYAP